MATKKTSKTFAICGRINGTVTINVQASDFEDALEQARQLNTSSFATANNDSEGWDYFDDFELQSIYLNE